MAFSTVHFMFASAIRGKSLPRCLRIACTRVTSDPRSGRPTFILIARKPLARFSSVLPKKRLDREIEVDAAGVTGHAGVEAAEETKQGQIGAARLQVPQRDIKRREREHRWSAASAVMQGPPDVMPNGLGIIGFAALDQFGDLPPENVGNRAAIAADGIGIADAFSPV